MATTTSRATSAVMVPPTAQRIFARLLIDRSLFAQEKTVDTCRARAPKIKRALDHGPQICASFGGLEQFGLCAYYTKPRSTRISPLHKRLDVRFRIPWPSQ